MLIINHPPLTIEEIDLIPQYRRKWQRIALNQEPINRQQAKLAINNAYRFLNLAEPAIIFHSTPHDALEYIVSQVDSKWGKLNDTGLGNPVGFNLLKKLLEKLRSDIKPEVIKELGDRLDMNLAASITSQLGRKLEQPKLNSVILANTIHSIENSVEESRENENLKSTAKSILNLFSTFGYVANNYYFSPFIWQLYLQVADFFYPGESQKFRDVSGEIATLLFAGKFNSKESIPYQLPTIELSTAVGNVIVSSVAADFAYYIDYCHQVLNCPLDRHKWNIFQDLITSCGWIFPYEKTVLVCDRITTL